MKLSVIIPTHNPDPERLRRTLSALRSQTLPPGLWETFLVDNASAKFPSADFLAACAPRKFSVVAEPELGLTAARRRGFAVAHGETAVLVDDDNELAPDYLATVLDLFSRHPRIGALGGKSLPEFATPPPSWAAEFYPLLALRDLGEKPQISSGLRPAGTARNEYPLFAPLGAGMGLRREAWKAWLEARRRPNSALSDRRGGELTSSGDNDIVLCAMKAGWDVGYFPELRLTHLIPTGRVETRYLARLNRGIQKSWMQVLTLHEANPWPPLTPAGAFLRKMKAWFAHHAWSSSPARIRWQGACGHFEGRIKQ